MNPPLTILLVSDDASYLKEVDEHLVTLFPSCLLVRAADRAEAAAAMERHACDLILLDHQLEPINGFELLYLACTLAPNTPVIVIAESLDVDTVIDLYRAGADDVVQKHSAEFVPAMKRLMARLNQERPDNCVTVQTIDLRASSARLAMVMELALLVIWEMDQENRTFTFDDTFYSFYGTTLQREGGTRMPAEVYVREFVHPDDVHVITDEVGTAVATEPDSIVSLEHRIIRRDGTMRHISVRYRVIRDETGRPVRTFGVNQDITERKAAEFEVHKARQAAEAANQAKSAFLATMSHEIRTPMSAIIGLSHLALQTELSPRQRDYLAKIDSSAQSLLGIVNGILDFSKIESGKLNLERVAFLLHESLARVTDLVTGKVREKGLTLTCDIGEEIPDALVGDPLRLEQVLINLLSNAVKFTEQGGITLTVALFDSEPGVSVSLVFTVADTGIGLSPEQVDRLFVPFSQTDSSTTRRFGGTGLGLSICRHLVEQMGGTIAAEGEPGKGSAFTFTAIFGLGTATDTDRRHERRMVDWLQVLQGAKVLLAEDNVFNQQIAREILESAGIQVEIVATGREALDAVLRTNGGYDVVLMDIQMPEMDGYEATRKIRERWSAAQLPIIAMTAHAMVEEREKCRLAGMNDHVAKPVNVNLLYAILSRWVSPRQVPVKAGIRLPGPETDQGDFPSHLPGLSVRDGLSRLLGNAGLYRKLIIEFGRENRDVVARLDALLDAKESTSARVLVHTLKGVSGNISALRLAETAKDMESDINRGRLEEARLLLPTLASDLAEILESADILSLTEPASPTVPLESADPETLAPLLRDLFRLLDRHDLRAQELFDQVRPLLAMSEPVLTDQMARALDRLDFRQALGKLENLAAVIPITLKEG